MLTLQRSSARIVERTGRERFRGARIKVALPRQLELAAALMRPTRRTHNGQWKHMLDNGEVERLRKQAMALSHFGGHALRTQDLDALLQEAAKLVSEAIGIELVKVIELLPDQDTMLVRAGVNWNPGVVGHATFGAHRDSPAGYALQENKPVISPDTDREDRFEIPQLLLDHGVTSMVNVVIRGERAAWGVLEVDSRQRRDFNEDDLSFLQNYANLLAAAIERLQTEAELKDAVDRRSILLGELQHRVRNMLLNVRTLARRPQRPAQVWSNLPRHSTRGSWRLRVPKSC